MTKLPQLSGRDFVNALTKVGFRQKRQHGSHIILRRNYYPANRGREDAIIMARSLL